MLAQEIAYRVSSFSSKGTKLTSLKSAGLTDLYNRQTNLPRNIDWIKERMGTNYLPTFLPALFDESDLLRFMVYLGRNELFTVFFTYYRIKYKHHAPVFTKKDYDWRRGLKIPMGPRIIEQI